MTIIEKPPISKRTLVALNNTNTILIDANITPIYPVRYAYANFFDDNIAQAENPPVISDLLSDNSLSENDGYVLRLLREGWLYIREEDDPQKGHLHIFKYEKIESNNQVTEKFTKYLFKNRVNAQDGLLLDESSRRAGYPFVFVRNGIKEVSIVYAEHEFHPDVIDNLNANADERALCMQKVNLDTDNDDYAVPASKENLTTLVEDYRKRQDRVLVLENSSIDPKIKEVTLDILTTESSYELEAESIATELQKKIDYGETARIVALFDPVGRQKEITSAHAKLTIWEREYASTQIYPFTMGRIVNGIRETDDEDIKNIVDESINWSEHEKLWGGINTSLNEFVKRQEKFAQLYTSFMKGGSHTSVPGALDTYFRKFFCHTPKDGDDADQELIKLCSVATDIFAGILASGPSRDAITKIINDESDYETLTASNAYKVFFFSLSKMITAPQEGFNWSEKAKWATDGIMNSLGAKWGEMKASFIYKTAQSVQGGVFYQAKALAYTANKLIPNLLSVYGLKYDADKVVKLTMDELGELLAKTIEGRTSPLEKIMNLDAIEMAALKQRVGQGLINWADNTNINIIPRLKASISVPVMKGSTKLYNLLYLDRAKVGLAVATTTSFSGLSMYFNVSFAKSAIYETEMSATDPVTREHANLQLGRIIATVTALTLDSIQVTKGVQAAFAVKNGATIASLLAPALADKSRFLTTLLTKTVSNKLMGILNFTGAIVSIWESKNAYEKGNEWEGRGHAVIALGSAMLFVQACYLGSTILAGAAAGTSWTILGGAIFAGISLLVLGIGVGMVYVFGKPRFQLLLEGSFWGVSPKHLFYYEDMPLSIQERMVWSEGINDKQKPKIKQSFINEQQEFQNLLYQPTLEIETDHDLSEISLEGLPTRYTYKFTLPGFEMGVSNLFVEVHTDLKSKNGKIDSLADQRLTQLLRDAMAQSKINYEKGTAKFDVYVVMPEQVKLYWYYQPIPDMMVPNRRVSEDGDFQKQILGMIDEDCI